MAPKLHAAVTKWKYSTCDLPWLRTATTERIDIQNQPGMEASEWITPSEIVTNVQSSFSSAMYALHAI